MNRLELLPPQQFLTGMTAQTDGSLRTDRCNEYSLFVPLHYEANYAYPLLVWLHGPGDSEQQLKTIMPMVSMRNYVAVAPRGLTIERGGRSPSWGWPLSAHRAGEVEQRILHAVKVAHHKANISPSRMFLAGFGSGGTAALRMAMQHPTRFAGAISLCGAFPQGGNPLARLDQVRGVPVLLACGQQGQSYAMANVCDDLRLLHSAGMTVSLRVYPGGDELCPYMLPDVDRWIMEQISATQPVIKG